MDWNEGIWMSKRGALRYEVIGKFVAGKVRRKEAAEFLGVRERTVSRMARRYEARGLLGIEHGNRGRAPAVKKPELFKAKVMRLMKKEYFDFNMLHALELLSERHALVVSRETFRRWCHEKGLVKRAKRRKGVARRQRERMPSEGMLIQMDGSHHQWNRREKWTLITAIDDATSEIPHAEFFDLETTPSTMKVLRSVIEKKGVPWAVYVDRAGCFGGIEKRQGFNQFKRACEELSVRVFFASSPEAKGRVERAFDTFQDRLIPELRLYDIWKQADANRYLRETFLPKYWDRKVRVEPRDATPKYRPVPAHLDLKEIFCLKYRRTVNGDHTVQWGAKTYRLNWPREKSIRGHKVEFRVYPDGTWKCFHANDPLSVELVMKPVRAVQEKVIFNTKRQFAGVTK